MRWIQPEALHQVKSTVDYSTKHWQEIYYTQVNEENLQQICASNCN